MYFMQCRHTNLRTAAFDFADLLQVAVALAFSRGQLSDSRKSGRPIQIAKAIPPPHFDLADQTHRSTARLVAY